MCRRSIVSLETTSLADLLRQYNAPRHIDYLSLDTEGSEYVILKRFPFEQYCFTAITVEHNYQEEKRGHLYGLLTSQGYQRVRQVEFEDWYLHPDALRVGYGRIRARHSHHVDFSRDSFPPGPDSALPDQCIVA